MKFQPINKTLLVEPIVENVSSLIPEELREKKPFTVCKILRQASDCSLDFSVNVLRENPIVVRTEGLENVIYSDITYIIVSEKFIVGLIEPDLDISGINQ